MDLIFEARAMHSPRGCLGGTAVGQRVNERAVGTFGPSNPSVGQSTSCGIQPMSYYTSLVGRNKTAGARVLFIYLFIFIIVKKSTSW